VRALRRRTAVSRGGQRDHEACARRGTRREAPLVMSEATPRVSVVPFYPTGSTFLVGLEVVQWTIYTVGVIMLLVVLMMQ
jgi:hypothetical protein